MLRALCFVRFRYASCFILDLIKQLDLQSPQFAAPSLTPFDHLFPPWSPLRTALVCPDYKTQNNRIYLAYSAVHCLLTSIALLKKERTETGVNKAMREKDKNVTPSASCILGKRASSLLTLSRPSCNARPRRLRGGHRGSERREGPGSTKARYGSGEPVTIYLRDDGVKYRRKITTRT